MFNNNSNITGVFCIFILLFCILGCRSCTGGYNVSNGKVYYNNGEGGMLPFGSDREIKGADAETFEIINRNYGRDKNNAYFGNSIIIGCDVNTFQVIKDVYSKDKSNVYYRSSVLTDKPQSFKILFSGKLANVFATDGTKVFSRGKPFFSATVDIATFEQVEKSGFVRDKNRVYNSSSEIDADPKTFEVIKYNKYGNGYARDKSSVFYRGSKVEKADVKTHQILDNRYHKDKDHVFKETQIVSDDPDNFQVPESDY